LAIKGDRPQVLVAKKVGRKEMTSTELDQEFRELDAAQMKANTPAAVDQIVGTKVTGKKEVPKSGPSGLRMMRADEESRTDGQLPPVTEILNARSRSVIVVDNVKAVVKKKVKKTVSIPPPIVEEME